MKNTAMLPDRRPWLTGRYVEMLSSIPVVRVLRPRVDMFCLRDTHIVNCETMAQESRLLRAASLIYALPSKHASRHVIAIIMVSQAQCGA